MDFYEIVEKAKKTGKVDKGTNEITKAIERGTAKLVIYASDVSPKEIIQHLPILCSEKGIPCVAVDSKQKLGISVGLNVPTASIAIIQPGETVGMIAELVKKEKDKAKEEVSEEKEEKKIKKEEVAGEKEEVSKEKEKKTKKAK